MEDKTVTIQKCVGYFFTFDKNFKHEINSTEVLLLFESFCFHQENRFSFLKDFACCYEWHAICIRQSEFLRTYVSYKLLRVVVRERKIDS